MTREYLKTTPDAGFAFVAFGGDADLKWLKILKPGFRHCFAVLETGGQWVIYNPLSNHTDITVIEGVCVFELMQVYRNMGYRIVPAKLPQDRKKSAPWGLYTCVEAVKRILGIHAPLVITPWNLFIFLKKQLLLE